jgi:hypothetical protein
MKHDTIYKEQVCQYLNYQYPDVFYLSDTNKFKINIPQQVK